MSSSDRSDALAPAETDTSDAPPDVPNGDVDPDRSLPAGTRRSTVPATTDDSGPLELGSGQAHEVLESGPDHDDTARPPEREPVPVEAAAPQLVSGDPLLRGPAASNSTSAPPKPPPPPPVDTTSGEPQRSTRVDQPANVAPTVVTGVVDPGGQPARRAARGAHVAAPRAAVAPTRPPEQPVATLRPTTVAPVPRLAGRRPRVRRVTRVVRHVDPWSVFKVAAAFSVVSYAIALVAGVLLWNVAYATGTIDNVERGMESTGWEVFELDGGEIFNNAWIGGLFAAVALTGGAVLVATLFNLITDLVGGIRLTVLEEEVIEKTASPMRRFATSPARRQAPGPPDTATAQGGAEARVRRARGG